MMLKKENGITMIALIVTIIVLIILAAVTITSIVGKNSILEKSAEAEVETRGADVQERVDIWKAQTLQGTAVSESDFIQQLKDENLVKDGEINTTDKIMTIGSRSISYNISTLEKSILNQQEPIKLLVDSGSDGIVILPIAEAGDYSVDWGDGNVTNGLNSGGNGNYHDYKLTNHRYTVVIMGDIEYLRAYEEPSRNNNNEGIKIASLDGIKVSELRSNDSIYLNKIIEILQWGETGLKYVDLEYFQGLERIASPSENSFTNMNSNGFRNAFRGCISLTSIPGNLFTNCSQLNDFSYTFYRCTSLTSIPENLFDNCPNVNNFKETFYGCTTITGNVPSLWTRVSNGEESEYEGNPDGYWCFGGCSNANNYGSIPYYWKGEYNPYDNYYGEDQ